MNQSRSILKPQSPFERVLHLQRTLGNQAVQELVKTGQIQAKLNINPPDDIFEREANRAEDQVTSVEGKPATSDFLKSAGGSGISRKLPEAISLNTPQRLDTRVSEAESKGAWEASLSSQQNGGVHLPDAARKQFEQLFGYDFGYDFSSVKIHSDSQATKLAQELNAQAFTSHNDIFFAAGKYQPASTSGKKLLSHELAHTIQQGAAKPRASSPRRVQPLSKVSGQSIQKKADATRPAAKEPSTKEAEVFPSVVDLKGKVNRLKAERGRGKLVKDLEDIYALLDSLIVCKNARGSFYKDQEDLAKLYSLVTGNDVTVADMTVASERINTLARLINIREGLTRKDDTLPWKVMNEPIPDDGPVKGAVVTQDELDLMLDDYYLSRGWNPDGVPTIAKLKELGMEDLKSIVESKEA